METKVPTVSVLAVLALIGVAGLTLRCGNPVMNATSPGSVILPVDEPLSTYAHDIRSSVTSLKLRPLERMRIGVAFRNTGRRPWSSWGKYPITISYLWLQGGRLLILESQRTLLPIIVRPGETISLPITVVGPPERGDCILRITLVQEGITWFCSAGAVPLDIPVTVR